MTATLLSTSMVIEARQAAAEPWTWLSATASMLVNTAYTHRERNDNMVSLLHGDLRHSNVLYNCIFPGTGQYSEALVYARHVQDCMFAELNC